MKDFEEQLRPVYPELVRYAHCMAGSVSDGDDLLQESLVRAWRGYSRLKQTEQFKLWVLAIIRNTHRTRSMRNGIRKWVSLDNAAHLEQPEGLAFEEKEVVRLALSRVPRLQREALVLYEVLGMSVKEIADVQHAKLSAVKSRLSRGRAKLRSEYWKLSGKEEDHEFSVA